MDERKVFCIGFHKTGTTSLSVALNILGYRVTGPNGVEDPDIKKNVYEMAFELVKQYDAFRDNPWPIIYKELDVRCPDSKFILTIRDSASWIRSQVMHFGLTETPMRKWIYGFGCPQGNEGIYIKRFEKHNQEVTEYFKDRSRNFLLLDLTKEDGWEKICPFLNKKIPDIPFPHANKAADRFKIDT